MTTPHESDQEARYGRQPRGGPWPASRYAQEPPPSDPERDKATGTAHQPTRSDPSQSEPPKSGTTQTDPTQSGTAKRGTTQSGTTQHHPAPDKTHPSTHPCPPSMECDTGAIDDLQCRARAVKAESDAFATVSEALGKRRTAFETARGEYGTARDEAAEIVAEVRSKVEEALAEIRCRLHRDEIDCLDRAFQQVLDCLEDCPDQEGCCVDDDCRFEDETWTVDQSEGLRLRVERVEKCFDDVLVMEPEAVRKRAAALQALLAELDTAGKAEPRESAKKLYARAKQVSYAADAIWGRFADVNEYQECLCCALTGSLRGRELLAQLAGDQAYLTCQEESRARRCAWLRAHMVAETLAVELKLRPREGGARQSGMA
ncbi:hypothetical protein G6045_09720 [Streptomyces sp. YC504]|uniref:Uncharacterized protein n=1 Tax=Streptomyces mesophilus TaxID=1775132 RepID=A0A6G4XEX8_9ACTN|nr:proline-rich domain-containing protein [Streptomyces mesophilus]NGO75948.1 hypothetical protein [Streptomyces mesophilus]